MFSSHYLKKKNRQHAKFCPRAATHERTRHTSRRSSVRPSVRPASQGTNRKAEKKLAFRPRQKQEILRRLSFPQAQVFLDFPKFCTAAIRENFRKICSFLLWQIASPPTSQNFEKEKSHYLPWVCTLHNSRFSSEEAFERRCFAGGLIQRFWEPRFHGARSRSGCFYWDWGFQEEAELALCIPRV